MPRQTRVRIQRQIEIGIKYIRMGQNEIGNTGAEYEKAHPDIYRYFCGITTLLEQVQESLLNFRKRV